MVDTEEFPEEFQAETLELIDVWEQLSTTDRDLDRYYISLAAKFGSHSPGQRSGAYRTDHSGVLLTDATGDSQLSASDLAIAIRDEIETPTHRNIRFAVTYEEARAIPERTSGPAESVRAKSALRS